jgi:hypothetical protein
MGVCVAPSCSNLSSASSPGRWWLGELSSCFFRDFLMGKVCKSMDGVVYQNDVTKIRNTMKHIYIYNIIYIYYFYEKMWKVPAIPATFPRWFHMIHRFKSLRSDPIWFLRSESPWVWEHVFRWTTRGCLWPLARFLTTASAYIAYHAYHFQHMKVTIYHKMVY